MSLFCKCAVKFSLCAPGYRADSLNRECVKGDDEASRGDVSHGWGGLATNGNWELGPVPSLGVRLTYFESVHNPKVFNLTGEFVWFSLENHFNHPKICPLGLLLIREVPPH